MVWEVDSDPRKFVAKLPKNRVNGLAAGSEGERLTPITDDR